MVHLPESSGTLTIRIVWGTGTGPTAVAAYDAALAAAGVHNFNLISVSSIIPADAVVEAVGTAPDLGPPGDKLLVVEARSTVEGPDRATAGLGWATGGGPGLFYEANGVVDETTARQDIEQGLDAGRKLRSWQFTDESIKTASVTVEDSYGCAVVLALYGSSKPIER